MVSSLQSILIGTKQSDYPTSLVLALGLGVFVTTFAAYALELFFVSGGLVWIPLHAAIVGLIAGCWVGYSQNGLLFAWLVSYTSLLGYHADSAVSEFSEFTEQLTYFVRLDGLVFLAVEGIVVGTVAFILGSIVRWGINSFRSDATLAPMSRE